ncbi:MAG: 2-C-methyl-D-erythritol 4-phosphate cytidylyltransferase [Lachnospiraceae bacterium]|nr:2-C-methyl-D-erythritol 4-phosphate cytidylyltransferase [Lachnospiraceae bacterium]
MKNGPGCTAIVLSAGTGKRMGGPVAKQYMLLKDKPVLWYSLNAMEQSKVIDDCVLVTGAEDIPYVKDEIVEKYGFSKVSAIVAGGSERYFSVLNALRVIARRKEQGTNETAYVFIHDGARPFVTEQILEDTYRAVQQYRACVAAVPSKDTIKIADAEGFVAETPSRKYVWSIQTPQVFEADLVIGAYEKLNNHLSKLLEEGVSITDDAGVVELFSDCRVKLVEADYTNIKITTPEDIRTAESFLQDNG